MNKILSIIGWTFVNILHHIWKIFVFLYILFAPILIFFAILGIFGIGSPYFLPYWKYQLDNGQLNDSLICLIVAIILSLIWYFIYFIERESGDFFLDH
jgi:uncharacterized RDD family membrane protein YckC